MLETQGRMHTTELYYKYKLCMIIVAIEKLRRIFQPHKMFDFLAKTRKIWIWKVIGQIHLEEKYWNIMYKLLQIYKNATIYYLHIKQTQIV